MKGLRLLGKASRTSLPITDDAAKKAIYDKVKEHDKADTEERLNEYKAKVETITSDE